MVIAVPRGGYGFAVTNYGARPVRDVHVVSVSLPNDSQAKYLNGNPLGRRPTIDVLPADGQNKLLDGMFIREFPGKDGAAGGSQAMQWPHESEIDYTLQYTDNDGHTWRRRCSELPELHTGDSLTAA